MEEQQNPHQSEEYDALEDKKGKYSLDKVESYFTLCENILPPRSNPLLAMEELHLAKQGSMTSEEFYSHVLQIVARSFCSQLGGVLFCLVFLISFAIVPEVSITLVMH